MEGYENARLLLHSFFLNNTVVMAARLYTDTSGRGGGRYSHFTAMVGLSVDENLCGYSSVELVDPYTTLRKPLPVYLCFPVPEMAGYARPLSDLYSKSIYNTDMVDPVFNTISCMVSIIIVLCITIANYNCKLPERRFHINPSQSVPIVLFLHMRKEKSCFQYSDQAQASWARQVSGENHLIWACVLHFTRACYEFTT